MIKKIAKRSVNKSCMPKLAENFHKIEKSRGKWGIMRTRVCVQIWYVSLRLIIRTPGKSLSALLMHAQMCQKIKSSYGNDKLWNFLLIPSVLSDFHLALIFNHSRNKQHIIVWHFCNRKGTLYLLHSSYRNSTWHNSFFLEWKFLSLIFCCMFKSTLFPLSYVSKQQLL